VNRDLTVRRNARVDRDLSVGQDITVGRNLTVRGNARVDGVLSVGNIDNVERAINNNRQQIERVDRKLDKVKGKSYSGIAAAASMATVIAPSEKGRYTVMAGLAYYEGEAALGVNATHRLPNIRGRTLYVNAGLAVTTDQTVLPRVMAGIEF